MSEDDKRRSESPPPDLKKERDEFLQTLKGARLTEEFVRDHERLERRLRQLEAENAELRAQVETDGVFRDLAARIERLEQEKRDLLSRSERAEAATTQISERAHEIESEFANLANLFVASNQLHGSLSPRGVTRRIKEVLAQLVGAERYAIYLARPDAAELVPIASEGVSGDRLTSLRVEGSPIGRVFRTGTSLVDEEGDPSRGTLETPAACIPLAVDEKVVGVIAIFSTLTQKTRFDTVDFELFKLLGQHAAAALVSASLFARAERKIPGLEAFLDLSV
jgi:hypothetical protein